VEELTTEQRLAMMAEYLLDYVDAPPHHSRP
jgi:hypothetical protein